MNTANSRKRGSGPAGGERTAAKKDLVFGIGATGLSVARYLKRKGKTARFIDSREHPPGREELGRLLPDADVIIGKPSPNAFADVGRIIVSPGIADREPLLAAARKAGIEIVSDIELFVRETKAPFVAVTGSNGKSTVTTLLSLMCEAAGKTALSGANLGTPVLDLLAEEKPDVYVLELSSFQLMRTAALPASVAVLLNISPDHLDWHASEAEYRAAKLRIFREARAAVYNRADDDVERHIPDAAARVSFGLDEPDGKNYGLISENGETFLARGERPLLSTADLAMVGAHNQANALAALAAGQRLELPVAAMLQVLTEFPGLPHRMQLVAEIGGVSYIDDSKATNVGAAIAAVESVGERVVLIAGGDGKGGDFRAFADAVHDKLRVAVLIGRDGPAIAGALKGLAPVYQAADMGTAVSLAASLAMEGDTVLLAPACASFDQYSGYAERGEDFRRLVKAMEP